MKRVLTALMLLAASPASADVIPPIEPVYAVSAGPAGVAVRMASKGCTRKADLTTAISMAPPRPLVLIARRHADPCQGPAGAVEIVWSYKELGLEPGQAFSLANPLVMAPGGG